MGESSWNSSRDELIHTAGGAGDACCLPRGPIRAKMATSLTLRERWRSIEVTARDAALRSDRNRARRRAWRDLQNSGSRTRVTEPQHPHLPIGHWLRKVDQLLTQHIDHAQERSGLTRTGWQILNAISESERVPIRQLDETMAPFCDRAEVERVLAGLVDRGLVDRVPGPDPQARLTEEGTEVYERALARQRKVRRRAVSGVSEAEYSTAIRVLERMAENLELEDLPPVPPTLGLPENENGAAGDPQSSSGATQPARQEALPCEILLLEPGDELMLSKVAPEVFDHEIDLDAAREFLLRDCFHLMIAVSEGTVVGFASGVHYFHPDKPRPELWINEVGVAPSYWRRQVGTKLVRALLEHGRWLGCGEAWVLAEASNRGARALYQSVGGLEPHDGTVLFSFELDGGK